MKEDKVSYKQIKEANEEIKTMKVGAGDYAKVSERVNAFRKVYPTGSIITEIENMNEDETEVRILAIIKDGENIISTARATEKKEARGKMTINLTDMIENCETSAVGRALGFAGFGIDNEIASGEDIQRNKYKNKMFEIYGNMFIRDDEAKYIIKTSIGELMRKFGVNKGDLASMVEEKLWSSLEDLSTNQLLKLEYKLKTINMKDDEWHELYHQNLHIKDVTPENQEVIYESSRLKFGKLALQQAGTDDLLKEEIINFYLNIGINLEETK